MYLVLKVCCRTSKKCRYYIQLPYNSFGSKHAMLQYWPPNRSVEHIPGCTPGQGTGRYWTRNRKVFYREVASLRFLRAILGRWDRDSNEQPVPAEGEAAETHVFWEGNRSSPLWSCSKADLATSCCLFWTCFPLTDCQKRSSLHTSVILTRKPNLGCDEWSICHRALTDFWESTCTIDWQLS